MALTSEGKQYTDSITGAQLDRVQVEKGRLKELAQMQEFDVTEPASWDQVRPGERVVWSKWVEVEKGGPGEVRSRLVATE
eukprot:1338303-Amphidinium_carterae.1